MKKLTRKQKRILIANAIRATVNGLSVMGVFTLWGSLGALEVERIGYVEFIFMCIIGIAMIVFSRYAHYKIYEEDYESYEFC